MVKTSNRRCIVPMSVCMPSRRASNSLPVAQPLWFSHKKTQGQNQNTKNIKSFLCFCFVLVPFCGYSLFRQSAAYFFLCVLRLLRISGPRILRSALTNYSCNVLVVF